MNNINSVHPKTISFKHDGKTIKADVQYNFEEVPDLLLVLPTMKLAHLKEIPFFKKDNYWYAFAPLRHRFPTTIQNIENCINHFFRDKNG